jgi:hypothetical protein
MTKMDRLCAGLLHRRNLRKWKRKLSEGKPKSCVLFIVDELKIDYPSLGQGKRLTELCVVLADLLQLHVDLGLDLPSETDPLADTSLVITTEDETQVFPCASTSTSGKATRPQYQPGTQDYYDSIFAQYVASVTLTGDPNPEVVELKDVEPTKDAFEYFRNRIAEVCEMLFIFRAIIALRCSCFDR